MGGQYPQRKPEQMHVPPKSTTPGGLDDPQFTPKEAKKLQGMKWLQAVGLQYLSAADDGKTLFLRHKKSSQKENWSSQPENSSSQKHAHHYTHSEDWNAPVEDW